MGNTNGQARDFGGVRNDAHVEEDPFAELADIFESELKFDGRFAETPDRRQPSLDEELAAAFEVEAQQVRAAPTRAPQYQTNYPNQARSKATVAAAVRKPSAAAARPTHLTDEEIDDELETVLLNLSAPAHPRGRIVVETQSFAPERIAEEKIVAPQHGEVDEFEELIRSELAAIRPSHPVRAAERHYPQPAQQDYVEDEYAVEDRHVVPVSRGSRLRRGLLAGGSMAALLLVGGVGFAFWQHGGPVMAGGGDDSLLIKADAEPYKVVPKDPGGRAYPNQNKAVYDRVAGGNVNTPMQQALLRNSEDPVDLPPEEETNYADNLPGVEVGGSEEEAGKDQTRVSPATEEAAASESVLQPRKVRTMTVGADGRLAMAEAQPEALPLPGGSAVPSQAAAAMPVAMHPTEKPALAVSQPDPIEVAAVAPPVASPPATPMPTSGFFVQVSSQPSEAAAQQSMKSFGAKYGSVVAGKPVGIQSAEIAGKGTYYRVRVAAETRDEANGICSKLKSAGATCLVTR